MHCAAEFAGDAVADLKRIESGEAGPSELDEIHFVAGQASAVMHGGPVTVECSPAPAIDLSRGPDPSQEMPIIDGILKRTVHDADTYVAAQQKADALRQKLDALRAQNAAPATHKPASAPNPAATPSPAPTAQNPPLSADQQRINEVYQQQKKNERPDYYALLRETQRALNEANSQKVSSQADADRVQKETQAIMAGQFTGASTEAGARTRKRESGEDQ